MTFRDSDERIIPGDQGCRLQSVSIMLLTKRKALEGVASGSSSMITTESLLVQPQAHANSQVRAEE